MRNRARCSRVGLEATKRLFEFFTVPIRNKNTRIAYYHAIGQFWDWRQKAGFRHLEDIEPIHVAAYIEGHSGSAATIKQHRLNSNNAEITGSARVLVHLLEFNQSTISLKKAGLVYDLPAIDTPSHFVQTATVGSIIHSIVSHSWKTYIDELAA